MKKFCNSYSFELKQRNIKGDIITIELGYFYTNKKDALKRFKLLKNILGNNIEVSIITRKLGIITPVNFQ